MVQHKYYVEDKVIRKQYSCKSRKPRKKLSSTPYSEIIFYFHNLYPVVGLT